jgi:hypothetical protein
MAALVTSLEAENLVPGTKFNDPLPSRGEGFFIPRPSVGGDEGEGKRISDTHQILIVYRELIR